jgi:hypothetical protein
MTRDDIIELALEHFGAVLKPSDLEVKLAMLAIAQEREACALLCDENGDKWADGNDEWRNGQATASYYCAIAIRERGEA